MLAEQLAPRTAPELSSAAWAQFAAAQDLAGFGEAWLRLQCAALAAAGCEPTAGVIIWQTEAGGYGPLALWPTPRSEVSRLGDTARKSLGERRGLCERRAPPGPGLLRAEVAYPVVVDGQAVGVAVVELEAASEPVLQRALQQLHWGAGWLESRARALAGAAAQGRLDRSAQALDLLAVLGEQDSAREAAMALASELAACLAAARVLVGFEHRGHLRLEAISHVAWFDRRSQEVARVENLMEEALDQGSTVATPALAQQPFRVTVAHDEQRVACGLGAIATVLLVGRRGAIGALTVEWPASPAPGAVEAALPLLESTALLCGPALEDKLERRRWVAGRLADQLRGGARRLAGRGHAGLKLGALAVLLAAAILPFAEMDYRVTAKSVIEGVVQRAAVAPFRGFVAAAPVRAGAQVRQGEVLATLDDRDLRLEQARYRSEVEQAEQKYHDANARRDRSAAVQSAAQQRQAQAQLDLVEEKLARARITAPIAGLVVSGDLSQLLGSPVEQGQTLFEVAPLDAYRVILKVDERDIGELQSGQRGQLVLAGLSREPLPFSVRTVTAVTEPGDGKNLFRVEAELDRAVAGLRPGMEGVGKVEVGERKLLWVWTHSLLDWARLSLWRWLP